MSDAVDGLTTIVSDIAEGRRSAASVIGEAAERIAALDEGLKAFVHLADASSRAEAAQASGPLAGVPLGVKDIFDTADMPTAYGSAIHAGFRPASDASVVAMARSRGAAVMGKTATTEFAFLTPTTTQNPAAPGHTPGGSSSGSAAAVAAGMVAAAFGSQTAGSVIRPAAFCGIAGFKPSFRLLPTVGMRHFAWTLDTVGLFARGVADVAMFADILSGRALRVTEPSVPRRIGLYRSRLDDALEPEMADALRKAAHFLELDGATLVDIEEPDVLAEAREAQTVVQLYEGAISLAHERRTRSGDLSDGLRSALDEGAAITPVAYDDARRKARAARRVATAILAEVDCLLAPSALGATPATLASTGSPAMNRLWTLTGNPVVNVPGLLSSDGLPLGISVVARFGRDAAALAYGTALEDAITRRR